jgi:N-methylhydantoinase B
MVLPEGKLISASPTAAMGLYPVPFPTIIDAIIKALEPAMPDKVTGAHFGTYSSFRLLGRRKNGALFNCNDSGHGGWGACATHDGAGPFRTMAHGDTRIIPIELQESLYPIRIEEFALRTDSAGAGRFRGGMGFRKRYEILAPCTLWSNFDRIQCPPWGVRGGKAALPGRVSVQRHNADAGDHFYKAEGYELQTGDTVWVETGGGGGYGPPEERALSLVERDVRRGYVSVEAAERDYGVAVGVDGKVERETDGK